MWWYVSLGRVMVAWGRGQTAQADYHMDGDVEEWRVRWVVMGRVPIGGVTWRCSRRDGTKMSMSEVEVQAMQVRVRDVAEADGLL